MRVIFSSITLFSSGDAVEMTIRNISIISTSGVTKLRIGSDTFGRRDATVAAACRARPEAIELHLAHQRQHRLRIDVGVAQALGDHEAPDDLLEPPRQRLEGRAVGVVVHPGGPRGAPWRQLDERERSPRRAPVRTARRCRSSGCRRPAPSLSCSRKRGPFTLPSLSSCRRVPLMRRRRDEHRIEPSGLDRPRRHGVRSCVDLVAGELLDASPTGRPGIGISRMPMMNALLRTACWNSVTATVQHLAHAIIGRPPQPSGIGVRPGDAHEDVVQRRPRHLEVVDGRARDQPRRGSACGSRRQPHLLQRCRSRSPTSTPATGREARRRPARRTRTVSCPYVAWISSSVPSSTLRPLKIMKMRSHICSATPCRAC